MKQRTCKECVTEDARIPYMVRFAVIITETRYGVFAWRVTKNNFW